MSDFLFRVKLRDDRNCDGCRFFALPQRKCELLRWDWELDVRPSECPLISVDELADTMDSHKVMSIPMAFDEGIDLAIHAMKAKLGLEEF